MPQNSFRVSFDYVGPFWDSGYLSLFYERWIQTDHYRTWQTNVWPGDPDYPLAVEFCERTKEHA